MAAANSKTCFLCGETIDGKISKEHIIGDKFLEWHDLKTQKFTYGGGSSIEYSRLKVPAHKSCNSEIGSRFEQYILSILRNLDSNRAFLRELHKPEQSKTSSLVKEALCSWLAKIYIGLIHWELLRKSHPDPLYQNRLPEAVDERLFKYIQRCFRNEWAFNCPTSLYWFEVPCDEPNGIEFDFGSKHDISSIYLKFGSNLLVCALADARLCEHWLHDELYSALQKMVLEETKNDLAAYAQVVGHVWAVREYLPVKPNLEFGEDAIIDNSRIEIYPPPDINSDAVNERAFEIRDALISRIALI